MNSDRIKLMFSNLTERLKVHEGLRLKPYKCPTGHLTIGYGRNLEDVGISSSEACLMLRNDIDAAIAAATMVAWDKANKVLVDEPEGVVVCLVEMAFILGQGGLFKFKRMWAAIERGDYEAAAEQIEKSKMATQIGPDRTAALAEAMRTGAEG